MASYVSAIAEQAWRVADAMATERDKRTEAEAPKPATPCPWRFDCIDCGVGIAADEDGCCKTCGRDAVFIKDGVPDYSMVAAGDESRDDAEVEKARREGRALAVSDVQRIARSRADLLHGSGAHAEAIHLDNLANDCSAMAREASPDVASLQAELAKLRAVAEAAASMGRTELEIDRRGAAGGLHTIGYNNAVEARRSASIALAAALDAALPNWRSAS